MRLSAITRGQFASALCAAALVAGLIAAPASPATAAPSYLKADATVVDGEFSFGSVGRLRGHLGRVHTGTFGVETDDDNIYGTMRDWDCPSGVVRPTFRNSLGCTLLRTIEINLGTAQHGPYFPTFTDALAGGYRNTGLYFFSFDEKSLRGREYFDTVDVNFRHRGPVTVTERLDESGTRIVTHEGPMTLTGRVGAMIIENRGSNWVTSDYYHRESQFYPKP